ncbi:FecR family protein [Isoalcanivorax beigongshangi]|uniref:DUF4880 domain-containing protein n=1 Tax=Isoalcanivorax beigongshangi TaxID=3238810 RepID=A0ABV4AGA7_9GAMM
MDWIVRLTSGAATAADAEAFRQWCAASPDHRAAFQREYRRWQQLSHCALATAAPQNPQRRRLLKGLLAGGAVAAGMAGLGVGVAGWRSPSGDYVTAVGEQRELSLGDLALTLNTDSALNARPQDRGWWLELLRGELLLTAPAQGLAMVRAGAALVQVRDAQVNVQQLSERLCITCLQGQVRVHSGSQQTALSGGQQLVVRGERQSDVYRADADSVLAWQHGVLVFNDRPLAEVVDELNRYWPGRVLLLRRELGRMRVQARFELDQINEIPQLIGTAYGLSVTRLPGQVVVLS